MLLVFLILDRGATFKRVTAPSHLRHHCNFALRHVGSSAMIRLVLFDIDGTLLHSGGAGVKAFARAFASEFGVHDGTERLKFAGRTDVSLVREFFSHRQIEASPKNFERFFQAYLFWLEQMIRDCEGGACPGVLEFHHALEILPEPPLLGLLTATSARARASSCNITTCGRSFPSALLRMITRNATTSPPLPRNAAARAWAGPCAARKFLSSATLPWTFVAPAPSRPKPWPWPPAHSPWRNFCSTRPTGPCRIYQKFPCQKYWEQTDQCE